jgi:tetratricopeptide (TPR) repeat protein
MSDPKLIQNRYQLIEQLGKGGMGVVYKAYDRLEKQYVALKQVRLLAQELDFASKADTDDTDQLRLSLAREFSLLATLRHPHILSVLDFGFDDKGQPYYTMTLLEGGLDVKSYAINISTRRRIDLMAQMLQALHYLHRRGILHRDLKPGNVFVTTDQQIKVMDFGLAQLSGRQSSQDKQNIAGTINYMAPELFQEEGASIASDLFAVGVMVYEIMVGKHPFAANTISETIMRIMTHVPDMTAIPVEFAPVLMTLLAKDPAARYATAYDALVTFYDFIKVESPPEDHAIRESFLQASAFVGREAELKQLTTALDTLDKENAFFLVGGESGVGKSRLLDELRIQALVKGVTVLRGQGVEGGGLPFQLWRNIVRRLLLMVDVTDLQAGILKDIVPDVEELLGREVSNMPELSGSAYQQRLVLTIVDLLREIEQPLLLLLEDLQWMVESLEPLKQILLVQEQLPSLMVVANYRNDETPNLPKQLSGMTHIPLGRLDETAVKILSTAILGEGGTSDELVQAIQQHSEGNAFFITETIRAIADEQGSLEKVKMAEIPEVVFTGNMQDLMRRRLRQVDPQYAPIQTLAAIFGREIDTQLLAHSHDVTRVAAWLSHAAEYGVVGIQENNWRFAHDKLRETLIADIPDEALSQIHRTAAETIEAVYPDDAGYNEALLAHWQAAGDLDKTYHYLLPVAKHMIQIAGTYPIAEAHLHQMLARLPKNDGRCIALWNWLADSAERQGNYRASQGYALQAQELATSLDDREELAKSVKNLADVALAQGEYARATDLFQQSLVINQQLGDQHGIASCVYCLGIIVKNKGEYARATDLFQQSQAIFQQLDDQAGIANCFHNLGYIAYAQGDYIRATDLYQQSLAINQQLGAQARIANSLIHLGIIAMDQGEYTRATEIFQQCLVIRQKLGNQLGIADVLSNLGSIAIDSRDYKRAEDLTRQSLAIYQKLDIRNGVAYCLNNLGLIAFYTGAFARAKDLLEQSLTIFQQLEDKFNTALTMSHIAWLLLQQRLSDARVKFYESLVLSTTVGSPPLQAFNVVGFAGMLHQANASLRSAELLGMVQVHPSTERMIRQRINAVMSQLETALPAEELQAALERGKELDLDTVVAELLAEFGESDDAGHHARNREDKRAISTAQPISESAARNLDGVLAFALAELNANTSDETMLSVETARQRLSAAQITELEAKLEVLTVSTRDEDTVKLGDVIAEMVAMLREVEDE